MLSLLQAEQIAFDIRDRLGVDTPFAFFQADQIIYYSVAPLYQNSPTDAATPSLIQAVYDSFPDQARKILRSRIFATEDPTETSLGMIKVAAKRLTAPIKAVHHPIKTPDRYLRLSPLPPPPLEEFENLNSGIQELLSKNLFMEAALALSQEIPKQAELYNSNRSVAALLISATGAVLGIARNSNARNRTRHAEVNLVQAYLLRTQKKIPVGSQIFVTLKCCKMCAALLWEAAEAPLSLRILYKWDDPGPCARRTVFTPRSLERERLALKEPGFTAEIEFKSP